MDGGDQAGRVQGPDRPFFFQLKIPSRQNTYQEGGGDPGPEGKVPKKILGNSRRPPDFWGIPCRWSWEVRGSPCTATVGDGSLGHVAVPGGAACLTLDRRRLSGLASGLSATGKAQCRRPDPCLKCAWLVEAVHCKRCSVRYCLQCTRDQCDQYRPVWFPVCPRSIFPQKPQNYLGFPRGVQYWECFALFLKMHA